jgi:molybdenum cofactor cytidylyltransferase
LIVAIVLAAGRSERMAQAKPLLRCGDTTFLGAILDTLSSTRVADVRVVLGHASETVLSELGLPADIFTVNLDYESGMLSSVRAGVRALPAEASGFLVWPVDHPLVQSGTVTALLDAFDRSTRPIVLPALAGKRGHPVLFAARLAAEVLAASDSVGLQQVVHAHADEVMELAVEDGGILADIDTPEAYTAAFGRPPH